MDLFVARAVYFDWLIMSKIPEDLYDRWDPYNTTMSVISNAAWWTRGQPNIIEQAVRTMHRALPMVIT